MKHDGGYDVQDAGSADASTSVVSPFFVRYANGGIVAFDSLRHAIQRVAPADYDLVTGVWDSRAQRMRYEMLDGRRGLVVEAVPPVFADLREALALRLFADGDSDLDELDDETLVARAHARLGLRRFGEMLTDHILPHLLSP